MPIFRSTSFDRASALLIALLLVGTHVTSFPMKPALAQSSSSLARTSSALVKPDLVLRAADDMNTQDPEDALAGAMARKKRRGVSKDEDGKSNVWSVEPKMEIDDENSMTTADVLKIIAAGAAGIGLAYGVSLGASEVDAAGFPLAPILGTEAIMAPKEHGTSHGEVQRELRFNVDRKLADKITNFNRRYAEPAGYYSQTSWLSDVADKGEQEYFDSNTGHLLFTAPVGRSVNDFKLEASLHGWPSFRDPEVNWSRVRLLPGGEVVSVDGTHLGHNIPDKEGNRYCINLVSIAGTPSSLTAYASDVETSQFA